MAEVTVRFFAAARAAAGESVRTVELAEASSLGDLIDAVGSADPTLADVLRRCSFLVNAETAPLDRTLRSGDTVDALPPFAGG